MDMNNANGEKNGASQAGRTRGAGDGAEILRKDEVGVILNFRRARLEWRRVVRTRSGAGKGVAL